MSGDRQRDIVGKIVNEVAGRRLELDLQCPGVESTDADPFEIVVLAEMVALCPFSPGGAVDPQPGWPSLDRGSDGR